MKRSRARIEDYTIGWVCALPIELAAATALLDEEHEGFPYNDNDPNLYTLGRIGEHNVVIACLPAGQIGISSAASVATWMRLKYTSIRFALMVGIGGGVPSVEADIRLGDVVISQPHATNGGVVQYDFGKTGLGGRLTPTGFLNSPPTVLLKAVAKLRSNHFIGRSRLSMHLATIVHSEDFQCNNAGPDILFESTYEHIGGSTCDGCNKERIVERATRTSLDIFVYYGTIAIGNQVMKDGVTRDRISAELGSILCFEMEAAGLMNNFLCLVIRGIYNYTDLHKNKSWQPYAAAAVAACTKEILLIVAAAKVAKTSTIDEAIESIYGRSSPNCLL
jgi:nucleoside phosphorylase